MRKKNKKKRKSINLGGIVWFHEYEDVLEEYVA